MKFSALIPAATLCFVVALYATPARAGVAQPAAQSSPVQTETPSPVVSQGFALIKAGKTTEALALLNDYLKTNPGDFRALIVRGLAYQRQNQNVQARDDFETVLAIHPEMEPVQFLDCDVLYRLRRLDDSIAACSKAIALDSTDSAAYDQRALSLDAKDDASHEALAISDVDRSIQLHPSAWAYGERCELKLELKRNADALPDCEKSLELDANGADGWVWIQRGKLALDAKEYSTASNAFSKAIENNTTVGYAYVLRAQAKEGLGQYAAGLDDVNHYLAQNPGVSSAYLERAKIELKLGKAQDARADAQRALAEARGVKKADDIAAATAFLQQLPSADPGTSK